VSRLTVTDLPCPPSLNNVYTNGRGHGRRVLTAEGRAFKQAAALIISAAAARQAFAVPPRARLRMTLAFWFANPARDGSNAVKLLEDAAAEALGFDDRYVYEQAWVKQIDKGAPRAALTLEVLE